LAPQQLTILVKVLLPTELRQLTLIPPPHITLVQPLKKVLPQLGQQIKIQPLRIIHQNLQLLYLIQPQQPQQRIIQVLQQPLFIQQVGPLIEQLQPRTIQPKLLIRYLILVLQLQQHMLLRGQQIKQLQQRLIQLLQLQQRLIQVLQPQQRLIRVQRLRNLLQQYIIPPQIPQQHIIPLKRQTLYLILVQQLLQHLIQVQLHKRLM